MKCVTDDCAEMVTQLIIPVTGDDGTEDKPDVTQDGGGVVQDQTPTKPEADDTNKPDDFSAKMEAMRKKYEGDMNKLKSALQKREGELVKDKTALERKLDELLTSTMDEGDKKQYQFDKLKEELEQIRAERDELKVQNEQITQFNYYKDYFKSLGVPESDLTTDAGLPELFQSGMTAVQNRIKTLEGSANKMPSAPTKKSAEPPDVAKSATGSPSNITTLEEAAKHFAKGDVDLLFTMAEQGNQKVVQVLNELSKS